MALSSYERKVLEDIEYRLCNEDPSLDALLSSLPDVEGRALGGGGRSLAQVWKESLSQIPRAALVFAAIIFVGIVIMMAAGDGSAPGSAGESGAVQQGGCGRSGEQESAETASAEMPAAGGLGHWTTHSYPTSSLPMCAD